MAERRRSATTLAAVAALVVAMAAGGGGAGAQSPPPARGNIVLRAMTSWWSPGQPYQLTVAVQAADPAAFDVALALHRPVRSRTEFGQTVQGRLAGRPVGPVAVTPVAELPVDGEGRPVLSFTPEVEAQGVYPLRVELRPRGETAPVDSFVTHLVNAPAPQEGDGLAVAWVVPVAAPPAVQPDGHVAIDDARAEDLAGLARSLDEHPGVALTLAPTPETVEALGASPRAQDRSTRELLVRALRQRLLLASPYVPTNLTAMLAAGLEGESAAQLTQGTGALQRAFGREPAADVRLVDERLSDEALAHLRAQQVDRLVVPEALLEPVTRNTTLAELFQVEVGGQAVVAAMADAGFAAHFGPHEPVLAAHRLLADLAVVYFDLPAAERGVVVAPPRTWRPSGAFADVVLRGLASSPVLRDVTLDELFDTVPLAPATAGSRSGRRAAARALVRRVADPPAGAGPASLPGAEVRSTRRRLTAFASALEPTNPVLDRIERTLLAAQSADLRSRERTRYLQGARSQVDAELRGLVMPQSRSITLTARDGEIPVTITKALPYPVRAVLRIDSDSLDFPEGDAVEVALVRRNTTLPVRVRARTSGSFPLRVELESPDGGLTLGTSTFTVRSTAVSGMGTALSIGAALFLLVWWARHLHGRRSRRLVPA